MSLCVESLVVSHALAAVHETAAGAIIECGVYAGDTSLAIRAVTKMRPQYAADTFTGMPDNGSEAERAGGFVKGYLASPEGTLARLINSGIKPVPGLLPDTLPRVPYCFAWLDLDLEVPTRETLLLLKELVVVGGRIGFHDYEIKEKYCLAGIARVVRTHMLNDQNWIKVGPRAYKHIFFKRVR